MFELKINPENWETFDESQEGSLTGKDWNEKDDEVREVIVPLDEMKKEIEAQDKDGYILDGSVYDMNYRFLRFLKK